MKNKLFALLLFSCTLFGLSFYLLTVFEDDIVSNREEKEEIVTKQPTLEPVLVSEKTQNQVKTEATSEKYEKIFSLGEKKYFLQRNIDALELYDESESLLGVFPYEKNVSLQKIYGNTEKILFSLWKKHFVLQEGSGVLYDFELVPQIEYLKKNKQHLLLKTDSGIFDYNITTNRIEYNGIFSDFLVFNSKIYIGIIRPNDKKIQDFFDAHSQKYQVVAYNTQTKKLDILQEMEQPIEKLYESGKAVYFETKEGNIFRLKNFE